MIQELTPQEAFNLMHRKKELIILDTRTQEEFHQSHIKNAKLLDLSNPLIMQELQQFPKEKEYLLYCHTGGRSSYVLQIMNQIGYKKIQHIRGGLQSWEHQGLPVGK